MSGMEMVEDCILRFVQLKAKLPQEVNVKRIDGALVIFEISISRIDSAKIHSALREIRVVAGGMSGLLDHQFDLKILEK
jgi:hypothetical protein